VWRHPNYEALTGKAAAQGPPDPEGEELFASDRKEGSERLRVSLESYKGFPYVRIQVWNRDRRTNALWPTRHCVSLRIADLPDIIAVLEKAAAAPARGRSAPQPREADRDRPRYVEKRKQRPPADMSNLPPRQPVPSSDDFTEFD